jgi:hypothetical protein
MNTYIEPTDNDAFVDFPEKAAPPEYMGLTVECPQCKGHGGWNLRLNEYRLHGKEDTPENRHLFSHFRAHCTQCQGYGYVTPDNADHIHKWKIVRNTGNCLNLYECEVCGRGWEVDSSG